VNVAICDYGAGNVRSVQVALERLGVRAHATSDPDAVLAADLAVLPGVGSARSAMAALVASGVAGVLRDRFAAERPILGICLGLQLALEASEEDGGVACLDLLPGRTVRLRNGRVPRIGWAPVEPIGVRSGLSIGRFRRSAGEARAPDDRHRERCLGEPAGEAFYFAHSYAAETPAATARSEGLVAEARSGSFTGVQFHPEKSGAAGARYLEKCLGSAR
jgi:imidazole glycerol-phosphate synthase subunit HisH